MQVYLNELRGICFDAEGAICASEEVPNGVMNLEDLKKSSILHELAQYVTYPPRYALGLAEELPSALRVAPKDMITLQEWLDEKGVLLDKPTKHLLARVVRQKYVEVMGTPPPVIARKSPSNNNWSKKASGFERSHLFILEASLKHLLELKGITAEEAASPDGHKAGFLSFGVPTGDSGYSAAPSENPEGARS